MRVLLIDDERAMVIILKRLLARIAGVTIAGSFLNGEEALEWLRAEQADIAFVDIQMNGEDGIVLAKQLLAIRQELKIVFVTSHKEYTLDAFELGATDYLVKPVLFERLEHTINRIARERSSFVAATGGDVGSRLTANGLGGLNVYSRYGEVKWISAKSAELFAYLLMHRGKSITRDRILEELFDGMPSRQANIYLNTAVYQLRRTLKQHGWGTAVVSMNGGYKLLPETVCADYIQFEDSVAAIGEVTVLNYKQACETDKLYVGDLYDEKGYLWSMAEKERLSSVYTRFSHRLGKWLLEHGHTDLAVPVVRKLVANHETDEDANALLLRLYAAMKDRHSLMKHYDKYSSLVREELHMSPGFEITRLFERLKGELDGSDAE